MALLTSPAVVPGTLARMTQPVLPAGGLVLRPWAPGDVAAVVDAYAEPAIQHWHARSMDAQEARTWIASWPDRWAQETGAGWAVTDRSGVVGQISLRRLSLADGLAELSYWVLPPARGRGVATQAVDTLSVWVLSELGLHRIELAHSTANPASCRVAVSAGYRGEGTKRSETLHRDGWHDMHLHARLADDLRPER